MTGISSIQCSLAIAARTSKPFMTGITISSNISDMPVSYCLSIFNASSPFSASKILKSSWSISVRISRFISESSTIKICCLTFNASSAVPSSPSSFAKSFSVTTVFFRFFARYINLSASITVSSTVLPADMTPPILADNWSLEYVGTFAL